MSLDDLPSDLLRLVVAQLSEPAHLIDAAGICRTLAELTDQAARQLCDGKRGIWSLGHSWRVQCCGRRYHSTLRVRRQLGGKTVGVSTRRRGQSNEKPTACCAIDNNTVAICEAASRAIIMIDLTSGEVKQRAAVDGIPTGICRVGSSHLALTIQSEEERDGALLQGVANPRHRLQLVRLSDFTLGPWWSCAQLSFPNGLCTVKNSPLTSTTMLCCANWNFNTAICVPLVTADGPFDVDGDWNVSTSSSLPSCWNPPNINVTDDEPMVAPIMADFMDDLNEPLFQPSDVAWLPAPFCPEPNRGVDGEFEWHCGIAVAEYRETQQGGAVNIFALPDFASRLRLCQFVREQHGARLCALGARLHSGQASRQQDRPSVRAGG